VEDHRNKEKLILGLQRPMYKNQSVSNRLVQLEQGIYPCGEGMRPPRRIIEPRRRVIDIRVPIPRLDALHPDRRDRVRLRPPAQRGVAPQGCCAIHSRSVIIQPGLRDIALPGALPGCCAIQVAGKQRACIVSMLRCSAVIQL
jgi:hypothetical protein